MQIIHSEREYRGKPPCWRWARSTACTSATRRSSAAPRHRRRYGRGLRGLHVRPPPPRRSAPERAPAQLSTLEERCEKFARLGADYALVRPFTLDVAREDAREYLASLVKAMRAVAVVVGENHRFGYHGRATPASSAK